MLLITEPFQPIVAAFGPTVGVSDYPAIAVAHPVSSLGDNDLRKLASTVIDAAEARLAPSG